VRFNPSLVYFYKVRDTILKQPTWIVSQLVAFSKVAKNVIILQNPLWGGFTYDTKSRKIFFPATWGCMDSNIHIVSIDLFIVFKHDRFQDGPATKFRWIGELC